MATATTGWKCVHTASITSQTDTTATIKVECFWQNDGWRYDIAGIWAVVCCNGETKSVLENGSVDTSSLGYNDSKSLGSYSFTVNKTASAQSIVCFAEIDSNSSYAGNYTRTSSATTVSVPAKTSYTVSYNANGGSNAPAAQTKWHGTNLTLSSTTPTRSGYVFKGWGTSASDTSVDYTAGGTYSANSNITLYAIWEAGSYTVSYNANGGTGGPGTQIKTHGVALTLSSATPTRANYTFLGWGTTSTTSTVAYNPGSSYTENASITLYAIWSQNYAKPRISVPEIYRCNSNGTANAQGSYARLIFDVATDKAITSLLLYIKNSNSSSWSSAPIIDDISNTGGTVDIILQFDGLTSGISYSLYIYVADSGGETSSPILTLGSIFPIDALAGGYGVAFGKEADTSGYMDCNFKAKFRSTAEFAYVPTVNGVAVALVGQTQEGGSADHTHSEYLPKTGGEISGYLQVDNPYAAICYTRFNSEWIGFYSSTTDANNNSSRKGYIGHDGSTHFYVNNQAGGSNYVNKAWTVSSDARLKENVNNMPDVFIDIWKELSPKIFTWNELNPDEGKFQFGLIAQDVIGIFGKYGLDYKDYSIVSPYKLQGDDTEYFGITYDNYQMMTALVLKDALAEVESLKSEVAELKNLVQQLLNK